MYRHVLAWVSLGPGGEGAALHAFRLARLLGSRVTLLHVLEGPEMRSAAELCLDELRLQARIQPLVRLEPQGGSVAETVLRVALEVGADLILLGARGSPQTAGGVPVSVALVVAANPNIAVQVVPPEGSNAPRGWPLARER